MNNRCTCFKFKSHSHVTGTKATNLYGTKGHALDLQRLVGKVRQGGIWKSPVESRCTVWWTPKTAVYSWSINWGLMALSAQICYIMRWRKIKVCWRCLFGVGSLLCCLECWLKCVRAASGDNSSPEVEWIVSANYSLFVYVLINDLYPWQANATKTCWGLQSWPPAMGSMQH